jgi:hypothetical protein
MDVHASISAEPAFERPQVALAADTAALLGRAEHALLPDEYCAHLKRNSSC